MTIIDLTSKAPTEYRVRVRKPAEVTTIVLHQTGFHWQADNPMWAKVRAHYVVQREGDVLALHDPLVRMRVGSGTANRYSITIEHDGSYGDMGKWWRPEVYGAHILADYPEQVRASRALVRSLVERFPSITTISNHRLLSKKKPLCCGPELWTEVGEYAKRELGLVEGAVQVGGAPLPPHWRGVPCIP